MLTSRQARFVFLPLMLAAMSGLAGLAVVVFRQGLAAGAAEAWMLAWVLAFIVALPIVMLLLPMLGAVFARRPQTRTIPYSGDKIPGAGQ
ncbi:MAG: DUF2798 domain-containing protein [Lysobacter sp.]